jgi:serine/threonine-protein kinase
VLRVCPQCRAASTEDLFCPNDGTRLVDPPELPDKERNEARAVSDHDADEVAVPLSRRGGSASKIAAVSPLATTEPSARPIDPLIGKLVASRYRVMSQLGEGGMGNVYRAVQESIEKKVALKVLKAEYSASPDMVVRFHREAVSACRIKHPNVVDVFDLGQLDDGRFYIAMDLLEGKDLGQVIQSSGPLLPARAVHIALQICRALNAAHQSGIVHRDLKPENIFLHRTSDGDEIVKIVDFGIAHLLAQGSDHTPAPREPSTPDDGDPNSEHDRKLTRVGTVFGTPEYMAPEQAEGVQIDHRADIYATGIILYKMLTGRVPFTGTSFLEIIGKHVGEEPPRMSKVNSELAIPRELEQVVFKSLAKRPEDRFENMARFAQAIAYAGRDLRKARPARRRMPLFLAMGALALGLALSGWFLRHRAVARTSADSLAHATAETPARVLGAEPTASITPVAPVPVAAASAADNPGEPGTVSPAVSVSAPAASSVEPAKPIASAHSVAIAPSTQQGRKGGARSGNNVVAKDEPAPVVPAPHGKSAAAPDSTSLPSLERCFETMDGVRKEVPCN